MSHGSHAPGSRSYGGKSVRLSGLDALHLVGVVRSVAKLLLDKVLAVGVVDVLGAAFFTGHGGLLY